MVGESEFARFLRFEAALTSEDIMELASTYRRMPVSYLDLGIWTSGGCQSGDSYSPHTFI
jgi:hypothetical protein